MNPQTSTSIESRTGSKAWRTNALKNAMVKKLEDAIMYCTVSLPENALDMENRICMEAETKKDYKRLIENVIDDIYKQSVQAVVEQRMHQGAEHEEEEEQPGPSRQRPPPRVTSTPRQTVRRLRLRNVRIIKGKLLKQRALRKFGEERKSPDIPEVQNSVSRKKRLVSRFTLQKYLCNLIEAESRKRREEAIASGLETGEIEQVEQLDEEWKAKLASFFAAIDRLENLATVPNYLCDPVSAALLEDPVVVPLTGHTYERELIQHHFQHKGKYDPLTKLKLPSDAVIPNEAMQDALAEFLQENEWAQTT